MTNQDFIRDYGIRELNCLVEELEIRLNILKAKRKIGKFRISRRKKVVYFYVNKNVVMYELAKVYYLNNNNLLSLLIENSKI